MDIWHCSNDKDMHYIHLIIVVTYDHSSLSSNFGGVHLQVMPSHHIHYANTIKQNLDTSKFEPIWYMVTIKWLCFGALGENILDCCPHPYIYCSWDWSTILLWPIEVCVTARKEGGRERHHRPELIFDMGQVYRVGLWDKCCCLLLEMVPFGYGKGSGTCSGCRFKCVVYVVYSEHGCFIHKVAYWCYYVLGSNPKLVIVYPTICANWQGFVGCVWVGCDDCIY